MVKNIIKEIIILLLMVLAIILVLGILLYDYVPNNKIIPDKAAYTTPENVSSELQTDSEVDTSEVLVTYQIDATDLKNYKKTKDYVAGKSNPFESIIKNNETEKNTTTGTSSNTNGSGTSQSSTTSSNTQNTNNNTEGYLPDKGTK